MSETVKMPALGESVTEGTVTRWLKAVGDTVEVDEPLLEVSTDKVDTEIPSPVAGTIEKILVEEDEDAEVGADLAVIGDGSGSADAGSGDSGAEAEEAPAEEQGEDLASDETVAPSTDEETPAGESEKPADASGDAGSGASGGAAEGEEVTMPALGESVTEGTVTRWLKAVGETVEVDEPLLEVSTDKVDTEIPSPVAGTLLEIRVQEDEDAEVGSVLAIVGSGAAAAPKAEEPAAPAPEEEKAEEEPAEEPKVEEEPAEEPKAEEKPAEAATQEAPKQEAPKTEAPAPAAAAAPQAADSVSGAESSGYVTPLVRKMAAEAGVDLSSVKGSGLGGRIRKQDVQQAIDAQKAQAAPAAEAAPAAAAAAPAAPKVEVSSKRGTEEKMPRIRKVIGQRMMESLHGMAQLTTAVEVDVTRIAKLRAKAKDEFAAREGAKLTFLPFLMMAAIEGLKTYPQLNSTIDDDRVVYHGSENIGMAADTERGLVVPVIKNAGDLNLAGLARQIGDLGGRAKSNKLVPDDLSGATFTITNTGSGGALWDTPIVPAPQVGILGTGTITKRPAVVQNAEGDDTIAIRSMMYLFLSYDHRMVDGGDAARFLTYMKKRLEEGAFEGELGL
ncbi:2-oxoglutarate dehydrogenase, E2 component, dihydrolipoamide succinyltransferase [Brachybacterium paraconglomeratum]|uniref:2-oxoglutarate dehydrogenase, E2 component, dihydrolipoamide succinyltransferase n=1 Tax=Brachybacterium paraconglomeratum TaxID=173362 RepID=UPI0021A7F0CB|nr:2-oxoglutarate dehydrogenase, E2 component, dihydrolipoamide succinyltransferase [Brachybacterium paraconglomeratum]MCT1908028.1 2-oxoglutarate dehydrogenase, E2 component, dihydrolipoamide succinyltransferase [Brachybacterium paraconglomeratum]